MAKLRKTEAKRLARRVRAVVSNLEDRLDRLERGLAGGGKTGGVGGLSRNERSRLSLRLSERTDFSRKELARMSDSDLRKLDRAVRDEGELGGSLGFEVHSTMNCGPGKPMEEHTADQAGGDDGGSGESDDLGFTTRSTMGAGPGDKSHLD